MPRLDLTGKTVNGFKVLESAGSDSRGSLWRCICPRCGREFIGLGYRIASKTKPPKDCGCSFAYRARDLTGEVHGALTVLKRDGLNKNGNARYLCKCNICGREKLFSATAIKMDPPSCGCRRFEGKNFKELSAAAHKKAIVDGAAIYQHSSTKSLGPHEYRWVQENRRKGTIVYAGTFKVRGQRYYKYGFSTPEAAFAWAHEAHNHICLLENIPTNLPEKKKRKKKGEASREDESKQ